MNRSCSWAADSNGLGRRRGGKYLGFFTSSITASLPSSSSAPSASLPSFPTFLAPLLVESGAPIVADSFFLPLPPVPSSFPLTFSLWYSLPPAPAPSCPALSLPPALAPYLPTSFVIVLRVPLPLLPPAPPWPLFFADSLYLCFKPPFISFSMASLLYCRCRRFLVKFGSKFSRPSLPLPWPSPAPLLPWTSERLI